MLYVRYVHLTTAKRSLTISDKHIHLSERMLHKGYDREGSVAKTKGVIVNEVALKTEVNVYKWYHTTVFNQCDSEVCMKSF
jgi:hypothetical protein